MRFRTVFSIFALVGVSLSMAVLLASVMTPPARLVVTTVAMLNSDKQLIGTGFFFTHKKNTYIVTNDHICAHMDAKMTLGYTFPGSQKAYKARLIKSEHLVDLCVLEPEHVLLGAIKLARQAPKAGDRVWVRGFPDGKLTNNEAVIVRLIPATPITFSNVPPKQCPPPAKQKYTVHKIYLGCEINYKSYKLSFHTLGGQSGSPVLNDEGDLIGVVNAMDNKNWALAIPFDEVTQFMESLNANHATSSN